MNKLTFAALIVAAAMATGCSSKPSIPTYVGECTPAGTAAKDLRNGNELRRFKCWDRIEWLQVPKGSVKLEASL